MWKSFFVIGDCELVDSVGLEHLLGRRRCSASGRAEIAEVNSFAKERGALLLTGGKLETGGGEQEGEGRSEAEGKGRQGQGAERCCAVEEWS